MNELHIYSTSRSIRQAYEIQKLSNGFMPTLMRMDEFENRSLFIDNKEQVDKLQRVFLLQKALTKESIKSLKIDTSLVRFFTKSDAIFKFFEELSVEMVSFETLRNADAYTEFVEHIDLLEALFVNYKIILDEHNLYDRAYVPTLYSLNIGFIGNFSKIRVLVDGYLSRFEMVLLDEISKVVRLEIEYLTSDFNHKMQERFKEYGVDLPSNSNVLFDFTSKQILKTNVNSDEVSTCVYSVEQRIEQVAVAFEEANKMVEAGIEVKKIVIVVPDESFKDYLLAYNGANNLNFAMGYDYSNSQPFKVLDVIQRYSKSYDKEDLKLLEFYGVDGSKVDTLMSTQKTKQNEFFGYLNDLNILEQLEKNSDIPSLRLRFERVFKDSEFLLREWLFLWLTVLKDVTVDDSSGGLITVMGVLETRGIDFDGVIVVDFNDGTVPSVLNKDMFLNSQVREFASLPTIKDRESLQKQYYNRLLQKAKMSSVIYVSSQNNLPSRFLFELGLSKGKSYDVANNLLYDNVKLTEEKDPVVTSFDASSMKWSNSRLSTYLKCKRKFYYKYIEDIKAKKSDELNEGEFLHKVLENVHASTYESYKNLNIAIEKEIDRLLPLDSSMLNYKKMFFKEKLKGYVDWSMKHFKDGWEVVVREKNYEAEIGGLKFTGRVDRIDTNDVSTLVLDYKSGKTPKSGTDFQMSIYSRLLKGKYQNIEFAYVKILENGKLDYPKDLEEQDNLLDTVCEELTETKEFLARRCDELKECKFCDYVLLCERGEYL